MAFENVNFGLLKPTVQVENPMDSAMKGLAMRGQQQQIQTGALQQQQLQKQMSDQQELQDTLRGAKSFDEALPKVQALGSQAAQGWMKSTMEMKQKGVQLSLEQSKLANEHLSKIGGGILSVANAPGATPQQVADYINGEAQAGRMDPTTAKDTLGTLPTDPAALPLWSKLQASKLGAAEHTLKLFTGETKLQDTGTGFVPTNTNALTGAVTFPQGKDSVLDKEVPIPTTPHPGIGPDGKPGFMQLDENGKIPAGWKPIPAAAIQINAANGGAGGKDYSQTLPDLGREAKAQAIFRGEQPLLEESTRMPANREVNNRAAALARDAGTVLGGKTQVGLNYKALADFEGNGKANTTIRALNTMTEHVGTARRMAQALDSGDIPLFNQLAQGLSKATGQPQVTNLETLKGFLAGEVATVAQGGHITEGGINKADSSIKLAGSPKQLIGALDTMDEVAGGKLVALNKDYSQIPGSKGTIEGKLTDATKSAFAAVQKRQGGGDKPYAGKTLPKDAFNALSGEDQKKFIAGGGRPL